jgi:peroxiredoxin
MAKKAIIFIVSVLMVISIVGITGAGCKKACPSVAAKAPEFTVTDLGGKTVNLKDYEGKLVMLVFWQTNCSWCSYQMPFVQEAAKKFADSGLAVLPVNVGESIEKVQAYKEAGKYTLDFLLDKSASVNADYCVPAFPASVFIDKQGKIKSAKLGAFQTENELEGYITSLN